MKNLALAYLMQKSSPDYLQVAFEQFNNATNMTDRMALFAKYFNSLTPSDRIALFGTIDFRQVEHALRAQGEKGPQALDRCLAQLQLILF